MKEYMMLWKRAFDFKGRSRRREFWLAAIVNFFIGIAFWVGVANIGSLAFYALCIYSLAVIIPGLSMTIRRLHDSGHTGALILICLVPAVGWIILLIFELMDGTPGPNRYGDDPKGRKPFVAPAA